MAPIAPEQCCKLQNSASSANEMNFTDVLPSPPFGRTCGHRREVRLTKPHVGSKEGRRRAPGASTVKVRARSQLPVCAPIPPPALVADHFDSLPNGIRTPRYGLRYSQPLGREACLILSDRIWVFFTWHLSTPISRGERKNSQSDYHERRSAITSARLHHTPDARKIMRLGWPVVSLLREPDAIMLVGCSN